MRQTLAYDRGKEMARHRELTQATGVAVYLCDPHRPWQRGTNGLVRQYLPEGTDLSDYSQGQLNAIAGEMNGRHRKTLHWAWPFEVYSGWLARLNMPKQSVL